MTGRSKFNEAVALFNQQQFFECHEVLEDLWRPLPIGPEKQFLQGLLQIGVGFHHLSNHNFTGARNKLQEGIAKLESAVANPCVYQPPIALEKFLITSQQALQSIVELGPSGLQDFPKALIPTVEFS